MDQQLCQECINIIQSPCNHIVDERALVGEYTTKEINYPLSLGYKILKILHLITFKNKSNEIFRETLRPLMKLKAECDFSGTDKEQYIIDYKTHFNIELDKDNVKKNSQMKEIIKASGLTSLSVNCGLTYQTLVNEMFNGKNKGQIYSYLE